MRDLVTPAALLGAFKKRAEFRVDRAAILNAAWDREIGTWSRHWELVGLKKGVLFVKPGSAPAAQELHMREAELVESLNRYFAKPWIKRIKTILTRSA